MERAAFEDLLDGEEMGFVVDDDAGVGGNRYFAIREGELGVDGHIGETPAASSTRTSSCAVLSVTCLILILPLSLALMMLSIREVVVTP
ncbi:MAG: hypothetical protein IPN74_17915 [Haliscomenobacter sp.]|nr:hypothetical protein [Haliscomenobacter sp.]